MKRLMQWAAGCILAVSLQLFFTYELITPHIDNRQYAVTWSEGLLDRNLNIGGGWLAMTPYYAWPILVTYGGALIVAAGVVGAAVWYYMVQRERKAINIREAAVGLQEAHVRITSAKAERTMEEAEGIKQASRKEMTRCKQEAAARIEDAEVRLEGSVGTNMGRQKTIQKLRKRVSALAAENQELRKQVGGPEEAK